MDRARQLQLERFRSMTHEERWRAAHRLYWSARRLKAAFIRQQHPEWSDERVEDEVKKAFRYARD